MGVFSEVVKEGISKELLVSSKSYIFDGAGGMRDELEKQILEEIKEKQYPYKFAIEEVASGGYFGSKEQCIVVDLHAGNRIVISNTTIGTYLYVSIYHLNRVLNTSNMTPTVNIITDIFAHQTIMAAYAAAVAIAESAFRKLEIKPS